MIYQLSFWIVYLSLQFFWKLYTILYISIYYIFFDYLRYITNRPISMKFSFCCVSSPIRPQHFHTQLGQTTALDLLRPCSIRKMWTAAVCSNPVGTEEPHIWFLEEKRTTSVKGMITMAESERNICSSCSHPASLLWEAPVGHVAPNQSIWR